MWASLIDFPLPHPHRTPYTDKRIGGPGNGTLGPPWGPTLLSASSSQLNLTVSLRYCLP